MVHINLLFMKKKFRIVDLPTGYTPLGASARCALGASHFP